MPRGAATYPTQTIENLILTTFVFRFFQTLGGQPPYPPKSATRLAQARSHFLQIKLICIKLLARPPEQTLETGRSEKKCDPACASQVALFKFDLLNKVRPGLHRPGSSKIKESLYMSWRKPGRTQSLLPSLRIVVPRAIGSEFSIEFP